uniref:LOW QUALITY PROTEIN: pleckstrin homology domain-containing family O member 2 n=1 Tax=Gasterosteus aculeatus aculeatus TaxID=481459 RepID=UPI001A996E8E|nr:LOW QUALITY PROTEIN: pleckstrin homology domain-containing family O member 2 [Gasterosteus aculeatus aculeatus]
MDDGAKEEPAQRKEPKFLSKAGWVKKAPGRLLASYKDRYVHVERTEIVVYENEDLQNCLERVNLENYDKCHELKSPFKKKHRLVLIRSPRPGNKVHDVKFQAQTAEEKEAWIKALTDGINRAKNKVFDDVTIDNSINLEHVTRTRPKGNRNRRPPTRMHMKEVADVSSDGILRLDLNLEDAVMPNGTCRASDDGSKTSKDAIKVAIPLSKTSESADKQTVASIEEGAQTEPEVSPQKKVIKPPMPPIKEAKPCPTPEAEPDKEDGPEKKVLKPPMPPSNKAKPCASPLGDATEEVKAENATERGHDASKKTGPPPTPPIKPTPSGSLGDHGEDSQSRPSSHTPASPSKENQPSNPDVEPDEDVPGVTGENLEKEEDDQEEAAGTSVGKDEGDQSISEEAPPTAKDDKPESPGVVRHISEEEPEEAAGSDLSKASDTEPQIPTETLGKSLSPPMIPKKKSEKPVQPDTPHTGNNANVTQINEGRDPTASPPTASDTSAGSPQAEEALPKSEAPSIVVSLNDAVSLSPLLCHLPGEKKKRTEEKSVDSGQHSDDDSEGSGSEDTLAASTGALRGSHAGLDVFDASEDEIPIRLMPTKVPPKPQVRPRVFPSRKPRPPLLLKPSDKAKSASIGDLLSSVNVPARQNTADVAAGNGAPGANVMKLETEVAQEMEKTRDLMSKVSRSQNGGDRKDKTEDLLARAMENLEKADHVLREVNKLKVANNASHRKSW